MLHFSYSLVIILLVCCIAGNNDNVVSRAVALWILKSRELHNIPRSVMSTITEDVQFLLGSVIDNVRSKVQLLFDDVDSTTEAKTIISQYLCSINHHLFQGLDTDSKQMSYFRRNFGLVVSKSWLDLELATYPYCYMYVIVKKKIPCDELLCMV